MTTRRMALTLSVFVAVVVLVGCRSNCPYPCQVECGKSVGMVIGLPPEQVVAVVGEPLKLRVLPRPRDFEFQWQKNGLDIEGVHGDSLDLKKVTLKDAGLYRCKIYRCGETAETNYTPQVALFATSRSLSMSSVLTPVAGPFQPNQPSLKSNCDSNNYTSYVRFRSATGSIWWAPPANAKTCTVTDTSAVGAGYSARVEVMESTGKKFCGTGTPSSTSFPVTAGKKYQFVIFVLNTPPPPSAGQNLSLGIVWNL